MEKRKILFGSLMLLLAVAVQAARVDTVMVKSPSMDKDVKVVYGLPDKAIDGKACPVVY